MVKNCGLIQGTKKGQRVGGEGGRKKRKAKGGEKRREGYQMFSLQGLSIR